MVAEGFSGLMCNAVNLHLFEGFRFPEEGLEISHLQYANDTLCIGKASVENLWTLKALLRRFEMTSELKVNFLKSCLIGVNVERDFMEMACGFLNCSEGCLPFKYLGLPVRANPGRVAPWQPVLDLLSRILNNWENKFVSLGGRIVLLNAVLNSIPIFYLTFMKMSLKVWRRIVRIQREFSLGGKIKWVRWSLVCKPKEEGSLGVRDVRAVNLSLLAKWKWRLIQDRNAL